MSHLYFRVFLIINIQGDDAYKILIIDWLICQMKTPFRIKRGTPSTVSTHHKSGNQLSHISLFENSTIAPSFYSQDISMPIKQQSYYSEDTFTYQQSQQKPVDLSVFNKLITEQLESDQRLSIKNQTSSKGAHYYQKKPTKDRVILGGPWAIPEKVKQVYDSFIQDITDKCQFKQGVLPKSSIYYFAIGNQVLFYDIGRAIKTGGNLSDFFMNQVHFEHTVYQIKQLQIKHNLFGQFKNKNLVLISHPWKFSFAALEFQSNLKFHMEKSSRWMRITQLNYSIELNTQIAQRIIEGNGRIYFMDKQSNINTIFIQTNDWFNKLIGNSSRYVFTLNSMASNSDRKSYYIERKAGIFKKIRHFSKIFYESNLCFSSISTKNLDLIFDSKRQLLFSLIDTNISETNSKFLSNYKILSCWSAKNTYLQKLCSISELQLYDLQIQSRANYNKCTSNYQISKLEIIDTSLQVEANLAVLLQCGIRLYFKVESDFQLLQCQFPPSIDSIYKEVQARQYSKNIQPKQSSKRVNLTHNHYKGSELVFNLREEANNHTFIIWKMNQDTQDENYVQINWGISMTAGTIGSPPSENFIDKIGLGITKSTKQQMQKYTKRQQNKIKSSSTVPSFLLHQLAKNTLIHPQFYIHSTEMQIDYLCVLRPVDKMVNVLLADITDEILIKRIFQGVSKNEIQTLLIQIYCDRQGLYLKDFSLIDLMSAYKKAVQVNKNENYLVFISRNQRQIDKIYSGKYSKAKEIQPQIIPYESLSLDMKSAILYIIKKLSEASEGLSNVIRQQIECQESIKQSIIMYLSRLLHFIWNTKLEEINKIQQIIDFLNPILQMINHFLTIYNEDPIYKQKQIKPFMILRRNKQEYDSRNENERKENPLVKLRHYVNKIIQLIRLTCHANIKLPKTFIQALAVQEENYEEYIFRMLLEKYTYPIQAYHQFKKDFFYFMRQSLEKSLKISQQIKGKTKNDVISIIKFHKNVPSYLLNYLQEKRILMNQDCKQILQNRINYQKIVINPHNPKQNISNFINKLEGSNCQLEQRNKILFRVNNLLSQYLLKNQGKQDNFYKQSAQAVKQIKKRLTIHELLIMEYEKFKQPNTSIVNQLRTEYFQQETLQNIVESVKCQEISIIFKLLFKTRFDKQQDDLPQNFREILNVSYTEMKDKEKGTRFNLLKKVFISNIDQNNKRNNKWQYFQDRVSLVYRKVRSEVHINNFMEILNDCLLSKDQNIKISEQMLLNDISAITKIIQSQCPKEEIMSQIKGLLKYPLIGPMMIMIGGPAGQVQQFYEQWFAELFETNFQKGKVNADTTICALYNWLNFYFLYFIIQTDGRALLSCTKRLLAMYQKTILKEQKDRDSFLNNCSLLSNICKFEDLYQDIFSSS